MFAQPHIRSYVCISPRVCSQAVGPIGYVGGPGSGTAMVVVGLLVLAEWRAPNVMTLKLLKLQHDRFQSADAGSIMPNIVHSTLQLGGSRRNIAMTFGTVAAVRLN